MPPSITCIDSGVGTCGFGAMCGPKTMQFAASPSECVVLVKVTPVCGMVPRTMLVVFRSSIRW